MSTLAPTYNKEFLDDLFESSLTRSFLFFKKAFNDPIIKSMAFAKYLIEIGSSYASDERIDADLLNILNVFIHGAPASCYMNVNDATAAVSTRAYIPFCVDSLINIGDAAALWSKMIDAGLATRDTKNIEHAKALTIPEGKNVTNVINVYVRYMETVDANKKKCLQEEMIGYYASSLIILCKTGQFTVGFSERISTHLKQDLKLTNLRLVSKDTSADIYHYVADYFKNIRNIQGTISKIANLISLPTYPLRPKLLIDRAKYVNMTQYIDPKICLPRSEADAIMKKYSAVPFAVGNLTNYEAAWARLKELNLTTKENCPTIAQALTADYVLPNDIKVLQTFVEFFEKDHSVNASRKMLVELVASGIIAISKRGNTTESYLDTVSRHLSDELGVDQLDLLPSEQLQIAYNNVKSQLTSVDTNYRSIYELWEIKDYPLDILASLYKIDAAKFRQAKADIKAGDYYGYTTTETSSWKSSNFRDLANAAMDTLIIIDSRHHKDLESYKGKAPNYEHKEQVINLAKGYMASRSIPVENIINHVPDQEFSDLAAAICNVNEPQGAPEQLFVHN